MNCDERLERLLNRCGQTISDLPKGYLLNAGESKAIQGVACRWFIDEDAPEGVALRNLVSIPLYQYILHLTDIIDRMETALENVCGERDYLRYWISKDSVKKVICEQCPNGIDCRYKDDACKWCDYMKDGVPDDWRADDN